MTEHLPECPCVHHPSEHLWCICDRLRACEERMLTTYLAAAREDAIAAAVQRVEAMTPAIYTPIGHPHEGCPDPSRHMTWEPAFTIPDILAAIKGDQP